MSRFELKVERPGDIEFELKATLTLEQWKEIRQQMSEAYYGPARWLSDAISEMVRRAEIEFGVNECPNDCGAETCKTMCQNSVHGVCEGVPKESEL